MTDARLGVWRVKSGIPGWYFWVQTNESPDGRCYGEIRGPFVDEATAVKAGRECMLARAEYEACTR